MHHVRNHEGGVEEHEPPDVVALSGHHRRNDPTLADPEEVNILVTQALEVVDHRVEVIALGEDRHPGHVIAVGPVVEVKGVGGIAMLGEGAGVVGAAVARIPQTMGEDNQRGR